MVHLARKGHFVHLYQRRRRLYGAQAAQRIDPLKAVAAELVQHAAESPPQQASTVVAPAPPAFDDEGQPLPHPLPTGTVTFCFTDIEGSSQLWEQHPSAMPSALARHDAILQQAVSGHHGVIFKTVGDSVHAAFARATVGDAVPLALVSLEPVDSEPVRFWSYVLAALDTIQPDIGATALALLHSSQPPPIDAILAPLLNALSAMPTDAVLVLEDYHLIDAPPIHSALVFVIDHRPPPLHLVITTRADPPLPLTRLRARQQLTELRASDLRFTPDEAAAFLTEVMGLPLTAEDVAALDARHFLGDRSTAIAQFLRRTQSGEIGG